MNRLRHACLTGAYAALLLIAAAPPGARAADPASPGPATGAPPAGEATASASEDDGVRNLVSAYLQAFRDKDPDAMARLWEHDEEVTVIENGVVEYGWERFYGYHLLPELRAAVKLEIEPSNLRTHQDGGTAWVTFSYTARIVLEDRTIDTSGAATVIARREPGGWRIVHTHYSGRRPAI